MITLTLAFIIALIVVVAAFVFYALIFAWTVIGGILTLIAKPFIWLYEKIFQ